MQNLQQLIVLLQALVSLLTNQLATQTALQNQSMIQIPVATTTLAAIEVKPAIDLNFGIADTNKCGSVSQGWTPGNNCFAIDTAVPTTLTIYYLEDQDLRGDNPLITNRDIDSLIASSSSMLATYNDSVATTTHYWNAGGCQLEFVIQADYNYLDKSIGQYKQESERSAQSGC